MKPIHHIKSKNWGDSWDDFELSTGRVIFANCAKIGISPGLDISGGYDQEIDDSDFTSEERVEIADYTISLWQKYKERAGG